MFCRVIVCIITSIDRYLEKVIGKSINRWISPSVSWAPSQILFHDPTWAYLIASKLYPGDPNAILAAQHHIAPDAFVAGTLNSKRVLKRWLGLAERTEKGKKEQMLRI
jgi:hypothetical protein